ncbi:MAG TPA: heparin lyase I family protein [Gillisia sp.]|nr:heparin lyase I family protein [Gillisia sp.]
MKNLFYILLITISACSPDNDYAPLENQSDSPVSPESLNLESVPSSDRNTDNLILSELFENPNLDYNPDLSDFYVEYAAARSFQLEENITRAGNSAGRFEINKNDPKVWGGNRTEFAQVTNTTMGEGWYGFSQYFPENYTTENLEELVGQWHDIPDEGETAGRSPSNAISTGNGHLKWATRWDSRSIQTNNITEGYFEKDLGVIPKGKWINWVVHIKFSHTNTGIVEVWMDGVKVIDRQNMPNCFNDAIFPYFKFGVYRWEWDTAVTQRVIYFDEVRVGNENSSYDEVKPGININMMVNSYTVNCVGEMEGTCLLVQEGDMIGSGNWENFYYYESIEGFTYEPGFVYGLIVKKTVVENPPADGSSIRYELVSIVSKEVQ